MWKGDYAEEDLIEMLLHAGNRSGKTVLLAILHIKFVFYKIGIMHGDGYDDFRYRTFDISPISRQAKECLRYIEDILKSQFTWQERGKRFSNAKTLKLRNFFAGKNEALGEVRYTNNALTYAFSTSEDMGSSFQGLPAGFVSYDECVRSHHLEEELDGNVYSRLGDYGKLIMLVATPGVEAKSQQHYYHLVAEAKEGINNFLTLAGSYLENIFIPEKKRESHARDTKKRNPVMARQVLYGDFVTAGNVMFETQVIEQIWFKDRKKYIPPDVEKEYMISVDWGIADKGDETVMLVWDLSKVPYTIVRSYSKKGGDPYDLIAILRNMRADYNGAKVIMDTSAMGGQMFKKMLKGIKPIGFDAAGTGKDKEDALVFAQILLTKGRRAELVNDEVVERNEDYGWIRSVYLPKLANQLATYQKEDRKLKQDWVMSFVMGCWLIWKRYGDQNARKKSYNLSRFKRKERV